MSFDRALLLLFIGLKLTGHIDWHWGLVLIPGYLTLLLAIASAWAKDDKK